jgi:enoyl-[acyl-carrier protein] reductase I
LAVPGFNVIGAAKASLDSIIRGLSEALGKLKEIRVNGIAPGPVPTKSLGKVGNVLNILETAKKKSPLNRNVKKEDVGRFAVTVLENQSLTGTIYPIDTGMDIMGN